MKSINLKKLILPKLPYLLFVFLFDKVGQAARLAPGADLSGKLLSIGDGFAAAFSSFAPSLHPADLLVGVLGAALIRLVVYVKGKNAKKYRRGVEYGSARWGSADDIRPYIDPVFENNVLLTQTERLMMNSRPKQPKYARNKNVLVVGGSGSGKTRFFVKPNLMQMHSSYLVSDPKGTLLLECGKLLERGSPKLGEDGKPVRKNGKLVYEPYRIKIQLALSHLLKGKTTIMIAHRLHTITGADQICVFHEGRLLEKGKHDELVSKGGRYADMWRSYTQEVTA